MLADDTSENEALGQKSSCVIGELLKIINSIIYMSVAGNRKAAENDVRTFDTLDKVVQIMHKCR